MRKSIDGRGLFAPRSSTELLIGLRECFGLECTDGDFGKSALATHMFSMVLLRLKGVSFETIQTQASAAAEDNTEHPELYVPALVLAALTEHLRVLASETGLKQGLTMSDLVVPDAEKTRRLLKHFVDFARRTFDVRSTMFKCEEEAAALQKSGLTLVGQISDLGEELETLRRVQRTDKAKALKKRQELDALAAEIRDLQKEEQMTREACQGLLRQQAEAEKQTAQRLFEVKAVEDETLRLKRCIIKDPKKASDEMDAHRDKLRRAELELQTAQERLGAQGERLAEITVAMRDVEDMIAVMHMCLNAKKEVTDHSRQLSRTNDERKEKEADLSDTIARIKEFEQVIAKQKSKLEQMEASYDQRRKLLTSKYTDIMQKYATVAREEQENAIKVEEYKKIVSDLAASITEHEKQAAAVNASLDREIIEFNAWTEQYFVNFEKGMMAYK